MMSDASWSLAHGLALIVGAVAMTMVHFVAEPARWDICYLPQDLDTKARRSIRQVLYCSALSSYLLPFKLGIPLRVLLLRKIAGVDLGLVGGIIALDGVLSLLVWSAIAISCGAIVALNWGRETVILLVVVITGIVLVGLLLAGRLRWPDLRQRIRDGLSAFDRLELRALKAASILGVDVSSYGVRHIFLIALISPGVVGIWQAAVSGIVATYAGIISGLPMGLLGYDATLAALLSLSGVSIGDAIAIAVLNRAINLLSAFALGLPAAAGLGFGRSVNSIVHRLRDMYRER